MSAASPAPTSSVTPPPIGAYIAERLLLSNKSARLRFHILFASIAHTNHIAHRKAKISPHETRGSVNATSTKPHLCWHQRLCLHVLRVPPHWCWGSHFVKEPPAPRPRSKYGREWIRKVEGEVLPMFKLVWVTRGDAGTLTRGCRESEWRGSKQDTLCRLHGTYARTSLLMTWNQWCSLRDTQVYALYPTFTFPFTRLMPLFFRVQPPE